MIELWLWAVAAFSKKKLYTTQGKILRLQELKKAFLEF